MMKIECTSCKKALDVDEKTLSPREPTAIRCPSCGVTLMVDQRKIGRAAVTGPVVRLAAEKFVPLPSPPDDAALAEAREAGQYVALVGRLFGAAEAFLGERHRIEERTKILMEIDGAGRAAVKRMRLVLPRASAADITAAEASPDSPAVDAKLSRTSRRLSQMSEVASYADSLRPKCKAPYRYQPIVDWQKRTAALIRSAYGAAAESSGDLALFVTQLSDAETQFASLVTGHGRRRAELQEQIAKQETKNAGLEKRRDEADTRVQAMEEAANKAGWAMLQGGGCGIAIAAAFVATIAGALLKSGGGAVAFFIVAAIGFCALAHHIGYNKHARDCSEARSHQASAQAALQNGFEEKDRLLATLAAHEAVAPEHVGRIAEAQPILTTDEYDELRPVADDGEATNLPIREPAAPPMAPTIPTPAFLADKGLKVGQQISSEAFAGSARTVGFRPGGAAAPAVGSPPILVRSEVASFDEIAAATLPVVEPTQEAEASVIVANSKRKTAFVLGAVLVTVIITSLLVWRSFFSLEARLDKALTRNEMFAPAGASVYDLYKTEAARDPNSAVLAKFRPRIHDALAPQGDAAFAAWYKDSDDSFQWETMERIYQFLTLIEPSIPMNEMRRLYAIGQQKIDAKEYGQAIEAYQQALKLDPNWALALNGIGKVYMIERSPLHDERLGAAYYERACAADPNFPWAPKNLGDYYLRKDDYANAERYFLKALAASPERASVLRGLGWVCRKTGRPQEAISYYARSLATEKDPEKKANAMKAIDAIRLHGGAS